VEHLIWVKWGQLDRALDKTTWVEMTKALLSQGIRTTLVTSFLHGPAHLGDHLRVVWIPPRGGRGTKRAAFGLAAVRCVEQVQRRDPASYIIVDWASFYASLPTDILTRIGRRRTSVTMDMRTFEFGFFGDTWTRMDWLLYANARLACLYNGRVHTGFSAIVPALRDRAQAMGASRRTTIWGSGFSDDAGTAGAAVPEDVGVLEDIEGFIGGRLGLVFHGVLAENRGLDQALRVMELLRTRTDRLAFAVVGDGALRESLVSSIRCKGLSATCRVFPAIRHQSVPDFLRLASLGCMLYPDIGYWRYNHPIKLVEYLSAGVPAIVSRTPVFTQNFAGMRGLVFAPDGSDASIADTLFRIAEGEEDLEGLSRAASEDAEQLTWQHHAETLAPFLRGGV
jgi:glycosyltransferase involved in cell wall biosynthesis